MKKYLGINRNKFNVLQQAKYNIVKKKNRFKDAGKEEQFIQQPNSGSIITNTTQNSVSQESLGQTSKTLELHDIAKQNLRQVTQIRKKITTQCKLRITVFRQSQAKKYDENISGLSKKAVDHILNAQRCLNLIRKLKGSNETEQKYYRNMQRSLALEIRECSRQLRSQQKEYFDRIKSYERNTKNSAIELSETQKEKMKDSCLEYDQFQQSTINIVEDNRSNDINQLVQSINKLSSIYKEINELVIEQGSVIDRIDCNIQETFEQVKAGNAHLVSAQKKASSSCAQKCMLVLVAAIVIVAVILGFKYSSS